LARALARRPLLPAAALLLLVLAMRAWLEWVGPLPGDRWSAPFIRNHPSLPTAVLEAVEFMGAIGSPLVALALYAAAVWFTRTLAGRRDTLLVAASGLIVPLNAGLKQLLGPTPLYTEVVLPDPLAPNLPSGHVAFAAALFGALAIVGVRHGRRDLAAILLALVPLMAVARVAAGAHLVSDVVAGALIGFAWLGAVVAAVERSGTRPLTRSLHFTATGQ